VWDVARRLGAAEQDAMGAASVAELFYAACSFSDDIQDGDAWRSLPTGDLARWVNVQGHLLALVGVRAGEVAQGEGWLVAAVYETLARMVVGQRVEIERDPWTGAAYRRVAELSAGEQFALYMALAARTAGTEAVLAWAAFGRPVGALIQLWTDRQSGDARLRCLDRAEIAAVEAVWMATARACAQALGAVGKQVWHLIGGNHAKNVADGMGGVPGVV
jgi:hypothetical protein